MDDSPNVRRRSDRRQRCGSHDRRPSSPTMPRAPASCLAAVRSPSSAVVQALRRSGRRGRGGRRRRPGPRRSAAVRSRASSSRGDRGGCGGDGGARDRPPASGRQRVRRSGARAVARSPASPVALVLGSCGDRATVSTRTAAIAGDRGGAAGPKLIEGSRTAQRLTLRKIWVRGNGCKSNATFALRQFLVEKRALPQPDQVV